MRIKYFSLCVLGFSLNWPISAMAQSIDGQWDISESVNATECDEGIYTDSYTASATQSGSQLSVSANGINRNGTLNGNTLNFSISYPEDGGTISSSGSLTFNGNSVNGSTSWTWSGDGQQCSGTSSITGTKIATTQPTPTPSPETGTLSAPILSVNLRGDFVDLSWSAVANASGYTLYYAPYPSADPISTLAVGNTTSVSGQLPYGSAWYVAVQPLKMSEEGPISNIENFSVDEPISSLPPPPAEASILTLKPGPLDMVSNIPPSNFTIIDPRHSEVAKWIVYVGPNEVGTVNSWNCDLRTDGSCLPWVTNSRWSELLPDLKWGDVVPVSVKGVNSAGTTVSQTSVDYFWAWLPSFIEYTVEGEETRRASAFLVDSNSGGLIISGEVSGVYDTQISVSLPEPFVAFKTTEIKCPDDYLNPTSGTVRVTIRGIKYGSHSVGKVCSGSIIAGTPEPYSNGNLNFIEFSSTVQRIVDETVETKKVTGRAVFQILD